MIPARAAVARNVRNAVGNRRYAIIFLTAIKFYGTIPKIEHKGYDKK